MAVHEKGTALAPAHRPSFANRVRLVDVNGSGTPDVLWGDAKNYRYIDLQGGSRPWVLTKVENGLGKTTEIEYSTSVAEMLAAESEPVTSADTGSWTKRIPMSVHVVKRVTERDNLEQIGCAAGACVTEYTYRDPCGKTRSQMVWAVVGSARYSCQCFGSSWLVMMVAPVP